MKLFNHTPAPVRQVRSDLGEAIITAGWISAISLFTSGTMLAFALLVTA